MKFLQSTKFNMAISLLEKIGQLIITLLCVKLIAGSLSLEDNGRYVYATTLVVMFGSLSCWAGSELIIPKLSRYKYLRSNILTHGWYLRLFYTTLSFIISLMVSYWYIDDIKIRQVFITLMLGPIFMEIGGVFLCWFMVLNQYIWITIARFLGLSIRLMGVYYLSTEHVSFEYYALAYLFELIAFSLVMHLAYYYSTSKVQWAKFDKFIFKKLMSNGAIIGIGLTASFWFLRIDRYILQQHVSYSELSIYSMAMQLNDAFVLLCQSILVVLINKYIFAFKNPQNIKKIIYFIIVISILAIIGSLILSEYIIQILFDKRYLASAKVLNMAVCLSPFIMLNYLFYNLFLHKKRYIFIGSVWLFGVICMLILANILIPIYHVNGAIYSLFISYILMNIIYLMRYKLHNL